jgi:hypothetical protein
MTCASNPFTSCNIVSIVRELRILSNLLLGIKFLSFWVSLKSVWADQISGNLVTKVSIATIIKYFLIHTGL